MPQQVLPWRIAGCAEGDSNQSVSEEVAHSQCLQKVMWTCYLCSKCAEGNLEHNSLWKDTGTVLLLLKHSDSNHPLHTLNSPLEDITFMYESR